MCSSITWTEGPAASPESVPRPLVAAGAADACVGRGAQSLTHIRVRSLPPLRPPSPRTAAAARRQLPVWLIRGGRCVQPALTSRPYGPWSLAAACGLSGARRCAAAPTSRPCVPWSPATACAAAPAAGAAQPRGRAGRWHPGHRDRALSPAPGAAQPRRRAGPAYRGHRPWRAAAPAAGAAQPRGQAGHSYRGHRPGP